MSRWRGWPPPDVVAMAEEYPKRLDWMENQYYARRRLGVISARAWMFDPQRLRSLTRRRSRITQAIICISQFFALIK